MQPPANGITAWSIEIMTTNFGNHRKRIDCNIQHPMEIETNIAWKEYHETGESLPILKTLVVQCLHSGANPYFVRKKMFQLIGDMNRHCMKPRHDEIALIAEDPFNKKLDLDIV